VAATFLTLFFFSSSSSSNLGDLAIDHAKYCIVQHDHFYHPYMTDCTMSVRHFKQNFTISYKRNSAGDYALLCGAFVYL
jgi:hypothetical protein